MSVAVAAETAPILLRIGQQSVAASDSAGLAAAVTAQNDRARIEDLPDTLNPDMIDPAKASAFAAALGQQSPETVRKLRGHTLRVDNQLLGVRATEPTLAEAFAGEFKLAVDDVRGVHVLAHSEVPIDAALAKARSQEAQTRLRQAETDVKTAEAASVGGGAYGETLARRSALAVAWRINALAWAQAAPSDPQAARARSAAEQAARRYRRPSGKLT